MYVYILTNQKNGTLYIGVTSNLIKRVWEHKNEFVSGFTKRYHLHTLVYYEVFKDSMKAIIREKQLKGKKREKKIALIQSFNPEWQDLYSEICK